MTDTFIADTQPLCANCNAPVHQDYCAVCGQKTNTDRLNAKNLFNAFLDALFDLDSKVWRTVIDLTRNPGQVTLDYISGKRVHYVNPVRYFVTVVAISIALSVITGEFEMTVTSSFNEGFQNGVNSVGGQVEQAPENPADLPGDILQKYMNIISLLSVPLVAFLLRLHNYRADKNFAETLAFQCYLWGQYSLLSLLFIPVSYVSVNANIWGKQLLFIIILYYGMKVFYNRSWGRSVVSTFFAALYSFLVPTVIVTIGFLLRMAGFL